MIDCLYLERHTPHLKNTVMEERDPEERLLTHLNESIIQEDISLPLHFQDNSLVALVLVLYITYIYCKHCTLSSRNKFLFPSIFYLSILIYSYCIVLYIAFYLNFFRKKKKDTALEKNPSRVETFINFFGSNDADTRFKKILGVFEFVRWWNGFYIVQCYI